MVGLTICIQIFQDQIDKYHLSALNSFMLKLGVENNVINSTLEERNKMRND